MTNITTAPSIDAAAARIKEKPVLAIDLALEVFRATRGRRTDGQTEHYLGILSRGVLGASGCEPRKGKSPIDAMLSDGGCDRFAAATLLRLLVVDDEPFETDHRLRGSTTLFERALGQPLLKEAGIRPKEQAYEKRGRLRTLVATHEEALLRHVASLGSLDALHTFRASFGQLFNRPATHAFVLPFLPKSITSQTFDELLGALHGVANCADSSLINRADGIERRCQELIEQGERLGTRYSKGLVCGLANVGQELVRQQVEAAGFSDPAQLKISLRPKRYPLQQAGTQVTIRLDLENEGPGQAQDVVVEVEGGGAIAYQETSRVIGLLGPGPHQVHFHGVVVDPQPSPDPADVLGIKVTWRDPDRTEKTLEDIQTLEGQAGDVSWDDLAREQPYKLEPVRNREDFVGRETSIIDLAKVVMQSGNARIQGEKRVGKTSLAYAVSAAVEEQCADKYVFVILESGDFNSHTLEDTVFRLGQMIAEEVRASDGRLSGLPIPDFGPGLTTLTEFFSGAHKLAPERSFVIVLDEFDALPHQALYQHEPVGDAFFQTLRSLGGKPNVGFILVGGEQMQWIISTHGQTLNKFKLLPLDYFSEDQMADYSDLVRVPAAGRLSFSDGAVRTLYTASAGNPWMTKLLLGYLFDRQVERRDQDVQEGDVEDAIAEALPRFDAASFQHFWDDAIRGEAEDREHVSAMRRRVLVALANCIDVGGGAAEEDVVNRSRDFHVDEPTAREVIRGFLDRKILRPGEGNVLTCRVPLFERWLAKYGVQEIVLGTGDDDTLIRRQRSIEAMRPTYEELDSLAKRWKSYKGEDINAERINSWLSQFGGPEEQRLVMPILEGLRFYTRSTMDHHMDSLHQFVIRKLAGEGYEYTRSGQQRYRDDLLICGLEGGGSGAAHLIKRYRDENGIYKDCAIDARAVSEALRGSEQQIRAVILLEDFVGTGSTATKRIRELHAQWTADGEWPAEVDVFLLAISGFEVGLRRVERAAAQLGWGLTVRADDPLDDADRCFHDDSSFFPDANNREQARALCARFGAMVSARAPVGFGNTEAAICFEYRCPNNSLPVLWRDHADWRALFPRH